MDHRPLVWLHGEVKSPPFSAGARIEAGVLLRRLQRRDRLGMPHLRLMPTIGTRCCELRIPDIDVTWRIVCRLDPDAVLILEVFAKKTAATPPGVVARCQRRVRRYDQDRKEE